MAETLGSLIDKLTISNLREFHIGKGDVKNKLRVLRSQKGRLIREIEDFIARAIKDKVILTDKKLKLYNRPGLTAGIEKLKDISSGIDGLAKRNIELWHLEDETRRRDVNDAYIGRIKKRIDKANQQRNDLIDAIDEVFKKYIKKHRTK